MVGQARFPFRSLDAVMRLQSRRVAASIRHAYKTVPYYRETMDRLDLLPGEFKRAEDLAQLPILDRAQLQSDPEYFLSTARPRSDYETMSSSGSTGAPMTVFWDRPAWFRIIALRERARCMLTELTGTSGYRETLITMPGGSPRIGEQLARKSTLIPSWLRVNRQHLSLPDSPEANAALMNAFKPEVVSSYGSYLAPLFDYLASQDEPRHLPKAVVFAGDALPVTARETIAEALGIPVFEAYQAVEAQPVAFGCSHGNRLHINIDSYPLRVVDEGGRSLPPGENGDIVVSNLQNRASVILNYRIGDVAELLPGRCECGRTLPLLSAITGRSDDWVQLGAGRRLHHQAVCIPFRGEDGVRQYQVFQEEDGAVVVRVVPRPGSDRAGLLERLETAYRDVFEGLVPHRIEFAQQIAPDEGGKIRAVRSLARMGPSPGPPAKPSVFSARSPAARGRS
jgi:phenylacetate-CoA ligase